MPLGDMLQLEECEEDADITRAGIWTPLNSGMQKAKEKFLTFIVPSSFLGTGFCTN